MGWFSPSRRALFVLVLLSGLTAEVLSTNLSIFVALHPVTLFWLAVSYGVPVLFIRHLKVTRRLGYHSVFVMGLAYGVINEGLIAKTLIGANLLPDFIDGWNLDRFQLKWMAFILPWHAVHSVLFPILLVDHLYPHLRRETIGSTRVVRVLAGMAFTFFAWAFVKADRDLPGRPSELFWMSSLILALGLAAMRLEEAPNRPVEGSRRDLRLGLASYTFYLVLFRPVPPIAVLLALATYSLLGLRVLRRSGTTRLLAMIAGSYALQLTFGVLAHFSTRTLDLSITTLCAATGFGWILRSMKPDRKSPSS